eukprot:2584184-Amphidinium_carterae.1
MGRNSEGSQCTGSGCSMSVVFNLQYLAHMVRVELWGSKVVDEEQRLSPKSCNLGSNNKNVDCPIDQVHSPLNGGSIRYLIAAQGNNVHAQATLLAQCCRHLYLCANSAGAAQQHQVLGTRNRTS